MRATEPAQRPLIRSYMPELDSVRGIAILMVLFFHGMAPPLSRPLTGWGLALFDITRVGWTGVNLFFVLSGFLITGILLDTKYRADYFRRFYYRRLLRIVPALYATLVALLLASFVSWRFVLLSAFFLANAGNFFGVALQYGPLWSLAVEEHFYLFWPSLVRKCGTRILIIITVAVWVGTPAVRLLCWMTGYGPHGPEVLYTWFNLGGLALGSLLAIWVRHPSCSRPRLLRLAPAAFIAGIVGFVLSSRDAFTLASFSVFFCNLACAGLLAGILMLGASRWSFLVDRPALKFFGFISYGLYLVHVLAFRMAEGLLTPISERLLVSPDTTAVMLLRFSLGAGLAIAIAYLSRRSLEEAFLRLRYTRTPARPAVGIASAT